MITLLTRDGSSVGNAILYAGETRQYDEGTTQVFHVETDFGNCMTLTRTELDEYFTIGRFNSYERWAGDRKKLILNPPMRVSHGNPGDVEINESALFLLFADEAVVP